MESNPENSMIGPSENSVSPPYRKRPKTLSDKDGDDQCGDALHQVDIYKNGKSDRGQDEQSESHLSLKPLKPSKTPKRASVKKIGAFAAQCAKCQKWRLISTKEKYEEIRERIREDPFVCEKAREWKPDVTCNDPSDVSQDGSKLWAIDKPDIVQAPQGWERLIKIRGEGSTKFADVYYRSPTGIQLRSTNEVEKYLAEHPEYIAQGVELSHFSFKSPAPLQKDYVRKRTQTSQSVVTHTGSSKLLQREEAQPISWAAPPENNKQLVIYNEDQHEVVQSESPEPIDRTAGAD
ncbi:Methyl-CpG-binding domain-containing protein 2 [Dichanthelium oligosanthes]|uniref:Methyl-CpG-binding domain-containing protein 2 n=1 Tax=Dichanthelium oligosanthes TaxID=888268 RepID=A0A1E5VYC2_9POAL|nr:Methyl-CpG-binding domain-containing protein 2 [Dichanthelium oligosanthes]